jgi:hypothetical protein
MNESTSDNFDQVPLPARQQLGYYNSTIDKDARAGNGLQDRLDLEDSERRDYKVLPAEDGGARVSEVTYHLDTTPPPAEPAGAPGSAEYNNARGTDGVALSTQGNATTARQSEDGYVSTQRESPGRNERYAAAVGMDNHASAEAGSGKAANVVTSVSDDEVPTGTVSQVMAWVGNDADKARRAEEKENERDNPRQSLLDKLDDIK